MTTAATIAARLTLDTSDYDKGISGAQNKAGTFSDKMKNVGGDITDFGKSMTTKVSLPILAAFGLATKTSMDFESQINILSMAARDSGESMDNLASAALMVGEDNDLVGITASEAADAMTNFYKAGLDTNEIMGNMEGYLEGNVELTGALRSAIDLAAASEMDLAGTSDLVAIAMATFGLGAEEATSIADSFVQAADASVASVGELSESMVNVGPTAAAFGWSLDDTNTALAILSERGIRGGEAGTSLKSMMTNLMRPTEDVTDLLNNLDVKLYDSEGQMKALPEIISGLQNALKGLSEEEKNTAVQTLAGTYGMKAMNTYLAEGADGWAEMEDKIANAATAQESASARTKGLAAALEQFEGTLETLMIEVMTPLIENFLTPFIQYLTDLAGKFIKLDPNIQKFILIFMGVLAVLGPVLIIVGSVITAIGAIIPIVTAVAGVLSFPLIAIIAAVIAVVALLVTAWKNDWGGIQEKTKAVINWLGENIKKVINNIKKWWDENGETVLAAVEYAWNSIKDVIDWVLEYITNIYEAWSAAFSGDWETFGEKLGDAWEMVWELIKDIAEIVWAAIKAAAEAWWNNFISSWQTFIDTIKNAWNTAWDAIKDWASGVWNNITSGLS